MALDKLKIAVEGKDHNFPIEQVITVLYNPNKITIKSSGWTMSEDGSPMQKSSPATLDVELFFDTSILPDSAILEMNLGQLYRQTKGNQGKNTFNFTNARNNINAFNADDVRNYVNQIFNLTNPRSELRNRPPICRLHWGGVIPSVIGLERFTGTVLFQGLLQSVTKTFTRFSASGIPTRATLNCHFLEYEEDDFRSKKLNPIDDPIRTIKQGDTLSSIAQEEYGNSALWRIIADANRLANPRKLEVGRVLTVPPLPREGGR